MRIKAQVILDEGLEVVPVLPHVADHLGTVDQVVIGVAKQLVPKCTKQTVAIARYLLEGEPHGTELRVQAAEVVPVARLLAALCPHGRLLLLVPPVRRPDLPLNSLLGHSS